MSSGHLCKAEAPTEAAAENSPLPIKICRILAGGETPPLHAPVNIDNNKIGTAHGPFHTMQKTDGVNRRF